MRSFFFFSLLFLLLLLSSSSSSSSHIGPRGKIDSVLDCSSRAWKHSSVSIVYTSYQNHLLRRRLLFLNCLARRTPLGGGVFMFLTWETPPPWNSREFVHQNTCLHVLAHQITSCHNIESEHCMSVSQKHDFMDLMAWKNDVTRTLLPW